MMMEHRYPVVLGKTSPVWCRPWAIKVTRFAPDDAAFGLVTKPYLGEGGFGEYVTVLEEVGIAALPTGVDPAAAGALGLAGTAAATPLPRWRRGGRDASGQRRDQVAWA